MPDKNSVGEKVKNVRESRSLTQEQLGERAGLVSCPGNTLA